ncbi:MAG: hydrogenase maturation nickel metallochaperone HypA [Clostridia bacterium]|nr:hydrogenase maturation nickel metallochaperone HypA [Clostridia bacterium]MDE7215116.1 hydrogenase maturation nickel metallochaperone HypA [Clostridia bacterium]
MDAAKENDVKKVLKLTLEIGEVSSIVPKYFTDCFEWAKKKTEFMQETELEVIILEGKSFCRNCKKNLQNHGLRQGVPPLQEHGHLSCNGQRNDH